MRLIRVADIVGAAREGSYNSRSGISDDWERMPDADIERALETHRLLPPLQLEKPTETSLRELGINPRTPRRLAGGGSR